MSLTPRYNETNTGGQTAYPTGHVTPANTYVTSSVYQTGLVVTTVNAVMAASGAVLNDPVERDSDNAFWDTSAGCNVPVDCTNFNPQS